MVGYLPDGVGVFASLGGADIDWSSPALDQVEDCHVTVVEADSDQVWVIDVNVKRHDATLCRVDVLRERWVLERVEQDHTRRLLQKLVCNTTE